jgi:hypothetical protein
MNEWMEKGRRRQAGRQPRQWTRLQEGLEGETLTPVGRGGGNFFHPFGLVVCEGGRRREGMGNVHFIKINCLFVSPEGE